MKIPFTVIFCSFVLLYIEYVLVWMFVLRADQMSDEEQ